MTDPVRVLGACGLAASALAALGGFCRQPLLIGLSGAVMFVGNLYALLPKGLLLRFLRRLGELKVA